MRGTQRRRKSQPGFPMGAPDMGIGPAASASQHRSIRASQVHGLALVPQRVTTAPRVSCTLYEELNARTDANVGPGQYDSWMLPSRSDFRRPAAQALDGPFPLTRGQQSTRIRQMQGNLAAGMVNEWVGPGTYDTQTSRSWLAPHQPSLWIGKYTLPRASSPKVARASLSRALMNATVPEASEALGSACDGWSAPRSPLLLDMSGDVRQDGATIVPPGTAYGSRPSAGRPAEFGSPREAARRLQRPGSRPVPVPVQRWTVAGWDQRMLHATLPQDWGWVGDAHSGMFGSGAWSGDERLELRHRSLLIPAEAAGPEARSQWPPPQRDAPPGPAPTSLSRHSAASQAGLHTSAHRAGRAAVGSRVEHGRCPTSSSIFPVALERQRSASVSPTGHSQGLLAGGVPQSGVDQGQSAAEELGRAAGGSAWRKGQAGAALGGRHASAAPAGAAAVAGSAAPRSSAPQQPQHAPADSLPSQQPPRERAASQGLPADQQPEGRPASQAQQHQVPAAGQQHQLPDVGAPLRPGTATLPPPAVGTMQRPSTAALQPLQQQGRLSSGPGGSLQQQGSAAADLVQPPQEGGLQESGWEPSPAASAVRPSTAMVGGLQQNGLAASTASVGRPLTPTGEGGTAAAAAHKRPLRPHTAQAPLPVPALVTPRGQKRHMEAFAHSGRALTAEARMDAWQRRQSSGAGQPTSGLPQRVEQLLQL